MNCKYCQSENVIKYGKYKGVQRYFCKDCKRKFAGIDTIPKMQYPTDQVGRPDIENFEVAMKRDGRNKGIFVGFSFSGEAEKEVRRIEREEGLEIDLVLVSDIVEKQLNGRMK